MAGIGLFTLDGAARVVPAADTRIEIQRLSAARGNDRFALTGPAAIALRDGGAVIDGLSIAAGSGRVTVAGRAGRELDLKVAIRSLPLSLARIAAPSLALSGTLDGEADLRGPATRPAAPLHRRTVHARAERIHRKRVVTRPLPPWGRSPG